MGPMSPHLIAWLAVAPLHLGALHPVERLLVLTVAFGPFLVLAVVVFLGRRRAVAEEEAEQAGRPAGPSRRDASRS
jgi:membrane protein implicated in regulation of membrane protease activity